MIYTINSINRINSFFTSIYELEGFKVYYMSRSLTQFLFYVSGLGPGLWLCMTIVAIDCHLVTLDINTCILVLSLWSGLDPTCVIR